MDGEAARLDSLERRMQRLELRMALVEAGAQERPDAVTPAVTPALAVTAPDVTSASATPPAPPAPTWHAPAPAEPALRPQPPSVPAWGRPAASRAHEAEQAAAAAYAPAAMAWQPAAPAPAARTALSFKDIEERFTGRALAWIGGLALVAAAVFFLSLAFSRGWITEPMRVLVGLGVGSAAFAGGAVLLSRRNALVGNVLAGVGLGILSISLMAATRLYNLVPAELGLVLALGMAVAAAFVAIRFDARSVAAFGLIAALAAPPLTGASASTLTLLFVAVTLVGTTVVALYRSWRWLPSLAFILAAPQLAAWLSDDPPAWQALIALAGFWAVNVVAAAGEEIRVRRDDLRPSSSILVLANATFLLLGLFMTLDGSLETWRGLAIALAAIAHLLAGLWFLVRQGWSHLFGNLVAGTGVALVAIATFVQLGAPAIPVAWAAEAVALAWLAARRVHPWSALAALVLGTLAIGHLVVVEYPPQSFGLPWPDASTPWFGHVEAASLGGVVVAILVAMALVPVRWIRSALAGVALLLLAYTAPFELVGTALTVVLTTIAVLALVADRLLERSRTPLRLAAVEGWTGMPWASCAAPVAGALALLVALPIGMPLPAAADVASTSILAQPSVSAVVVLAGLLAAGALLAVRWVRSGLAAVAVVVIAWTGAFELQGTPLVAVLAVLLPVGVLVDRGLARLPDGARYPVLARAPVVAMLASAAGALSWVLGVGSMTVQWPIFLWSSLPATPFTDERTIAAILLIGSAVAAARWLGAGWPAHAARLAAIGVAAWVIPSEVAIAWTVILWVALAGVALLLGVRQGTTGRRGIDVRAAYGAVALLLWAISAAVAVVLLAPPTHLWVDAEPAALSGPWMAAFAMLAGGLVVGARSDLGRGASRLLLTGAGLVALYAVSIAVVDVFAQRVGDGTPVEELAKQAQVALSVCWTAIGVLLLGIGLRQGVAMLRHAGLVLLGAAITKVVLIDMASMDVAYRALVLFGLGLLLLAGAWLVNRFRGPRAGAPDPRGQPHPA